MVTVLRTYKVSVSLLGTLCTSSFVFGSAVSLGIYFELKKTFKSDLGIDQSSFLWNLQPNKRLSYLPLFALVVQLVFGFSPLFSGEFFMVHFCDF